MAADVRLAYALFSRNRGEASRFHGSREYAHQMKTVHRAPQSKQFMLI
jgi:hypothetical protein